MKQVIEKMEAIILSSKKIVNIIGVIDSIAFQTNILSLNTATGEQGRGGNQSAQSGTASGLCSQRD